MARCFEHGNERSDYIKCRIVLELLTDYQLLKDCAPWSYCVVRSRNLRCEV
jgi:hypothetical protein